MESQPPTPKSVRPPLPGDVDAELRAACTWIVTHPKPSHEIWDTSTSKPALDYRAIKYAEAGPTSSVPVVVKRHSIRSREPSKQDLLPDSIKYSYRPNVAAEDLFKLADVNAKAARSRVEQLMAPEVPRSVPAPAASGSSRQRSESHSHSHSHSASTQQHVTRAEVGEKKRVSTRSDSIGTSGSTPHTDSTEYPWSASTAMTSAVMTPSRSKRASTQAIASGLEGGISQKAKADAVNAEWMRLELEKHFRTLEKVQHVEHDEPVICSATYVPSGNSPRYSRDFTHVPARKPVPSRNSSAQPGRASRLANCQNIKGESSPPRRGRQATTDQEDRGRSPPRSYSRIGRASRAASRAASGAASRAGSFANEIFVQLDLRSTQPPPVPSDTQRSSSKAPSRALSRGPTRPPSRARSISRHVKEYFRPGSSVHTRKDSIDSGRSNTATSDGRSERGRGWRVLQRGHSAFDLSRPGSSASRATAGEAPSPRNGKPVVDLNRELPPLPGLDKWDGGQTESDQTSTLTRALSKMDLAKNAHVARLATKSSRRQQTQDVSSNPGSPRSSTFQPHTQGWKQSSSGATNREPLEDSSRHRPMSQSQRVARPQTRGVVPASNRHGFVDPDSDVISAGLARESSLPAQDYHRNALQSSARSHQRSPTIDGKTRRKWWPGNLRRSPSQASRMDSVIRPSSEMPMV